jgi:hypothetical protein
MSLGIRETAVLSASEASWIESYLKPRYPDLVASYIQAREIVSAARVSGQLTAGQADQLAIMASSRRKPLGENVAGMVGELAADFPEADRVLQHLATAREVHCRINALAALDSITPCSTHIRLVALLLRDRSAKVRALAASKAMSFGLKELVPALSDAIERETNEKLRAELRWNCDLLRDGYSCKDQGDGCLWISCRRDGGVVSTSFRVKEFESEGRRWIAEQIS